MIISLVYNIDGVFTPSTDPFTLKSYSINISIFLSIIMMGSESVSAKHISPERGKYISPGQRPGVKIAVISKALKGRNIIIVMHIYFALSGLYFTPILLLLLLLLLLHRALPCAEISCPFRALNWHLLNILILLETRKKFFIMNII